LARPRTAPARAVERAEVVEAALEGTPVEEIAVQMQLARGTVYLWLHRFEEREIVGPQDHPRGGRLPTYSREQVSQITATALERPQQLGLPYAAWTLDRLAAHLAEQKGITMKRSWLDEVLLSKGRAGASRRIGSASGWIPSLPRKGGHRAALHRPTRRSHRPLSRRAGCGSGKELRGPSPHPPERTSG
jgi:transposase